MKKIITLFAFVTAACAFSQSKYTAEQVEASSDPKVIANFVKYNPNNPKTPEFKRKLIAIISGDNSSIAKPSVKKLEPEVLKKEVNKAVAAGKSDPKVQKTVDLLNHLFSNDPNRPEAYIQIENKSKCNLIVKISGKRFYNLDVPANNQNFILVDKGTYTLTTSVCDAKYSSVKDIRKDIVITLNSPKK